MRVTAVMPAELVAAVDLAATREGKSRSAAMVAAAERWCEGRGTWPGAHMDRPGMDACVVVRNLDGTHRCINSGAALTGSRFADVAWVGPGCDPQWLTEVLSTRAQRPPPMLAVLTATGAELDAIAARTPAGGRRPVPLREGEPPPPSKWDWRSMPEGHRRETDAELRARVLGDMREPNVGTDTAGVSAADVAARGEVQDG